MPKIENTAPLLQGGKKLKRRFLGNLFPKTTFEKNELQAYIKGKELFYYKRDVIGNPVSYPVRQEYYYEEVKQEN